MGAAQRVQTARITAAIFISFLGAWTRERERELHHATLPGNCIFVDEPYLIVVVSASGIVDQRGGVEDHGGQIAFGLG
jgi:hypothetical protein